MPTVCDVVYILFEIRRDHLAKQECERRSYRSFNSLVVFLDDRESSHLGIYNDWH